VSVVGSAGFGHLEGLRDKAEGVVNPGGVAVGSVGFEPTTNRL
jgi:hypothetical protein